MKTLILLCLAAMLLIFPRDQWAQNNIKVVSVGGTPGSDVTVRITATSDRNIAGIIFTVNFDQTKLQIKETANGADAANMTPVAVDVTAANANGLLEVGLVDFTFANLVAAGTDKELFVITFTIDAAASGTIPIILGKVSAADETATDILMSIINGAVYVSDLVDSVDPDTLIIGSDSVFVGNEAIVPVHIISKSNLAGISTTLIFDPTVLDLNAVDLGADAGQMTFVGLDVNTASESGQLLIEMVDFTASSPITPGTKEILKLTFVGKSVTQSTISMVNTVGSDPSGNIILITALDGTITNLQGCDFSGDGNIMINDIVLFMLSARDNPSDPRFDWNGDGEYMINDAVLLLMDIMNGNCPDVGVLLAAESNPGPVTKMEGLSAEDISYIERMMEQMNLTPEQEAAFRLALYGESGPGRLPQAFSLSQNIPNPFNPSTTIGFTVAEGPAVHVGLKIYGIRGRLVRTLVDEDRKAGAYTVFWNGTDAMGHQVASGVYFYRMSAGEFMQTRKMVLLK